MGVEVKGPVGLWIFTAGSDTSGDDTIGLMGI